MEGRALDVVMRREVDRRSSPGSSGGGVSGKRMGVSGDVR